MTVKGLTYYGLKKANRAERQRSNPAVTMLLAMLLLGLSGCGFGPGLLPGGETDVVVEDAKDEPQANTTEEPEQQTGAIVHAIENDENIIVINDPWELLRQAENASEPEAPTLIIRAINEFINRGQRYSAESTLDKLSGFSLTTEQLLSVDLIKASLASANGDYLLAAQILSAANLDSVNDLELKKQVLTSLADAQLTSNQKSGATSTLISLDALLEGEEQLQNQRSILRLLQSLDPLHLSLLKESSNSTDVSGWLALLEILNSATPEQRENELLGWRDRFSFHPIHSSLLNLQGPTRNLQQYKQIALLLPLTSKFGKAAQAFHDGFMAAHSKNESARSPQILIYDIGEEAFLTSFYYQAAINDGADFIVGPLGRKAAEDLLSTKQPEVNTLLIADVPEDNTYETLYGIGLSPEKEARQVAQKAYADGHRHATVFRSDSAWGKRVTNAFVSQWQLLGGTIIKNKSFPKEISDFSRIIQKLLGLDKSVARHRLLEAQSGANLKFTPRRDDNMDFLFLAATAEQSRLVVPQLRFFQAHNLPIYATSYIYDGKPNPALDADLDGLIFGEMKWMVDGVEIYKQELARQKALAEALTVTLDGNTEESEEQEESLSIEQQPEIDIVDLDPPTSRNNPYKNTTLERLYALGLQSYQLLPAIKFLRENSWDRLNGEAMTISVDPQGNAVRHPVWSTFKSGLVEPLPTENIDSALPNQNSIQIN